MIRKLMELSPEAKQRKSLLPDWIRFFSWIFVLFLIVSPFLLVGLITDAHISLSMYGIYYYGQAFHPVGLVLVMLAFLLGLTGYSLLWAKKWGVYMGIIQGVLGLFLPVLVSILALMQGGYKIPLELIFFIPWIIKMLKIKNEWLSGKGNPSTRST